MRRTPPVVVHLQPQLQVQGAVSALVAIAGLGLVAWAAGHAELAWGALVLVPVLAAAAWRQAAVRPRQLRWDGQAWWLSHAPDAAEAPVQLVVLIDLDGWLLLRAQAPRTTVWLPLMRSQQPQWAALRATLFSAPAGLPSP